MSNLNPISIIIIDEYTNKIVPILCNISRNIYNSVLFYVLEYYNKTNKIQDFNDIISYITKSRDYKSLHEDIAKYTTAIILNQISSVIQKFDKSKNEIDSKHFILKSFYNDIFIPDSVIDFNPFNNQISIYLGSMFEQIYNCSSIQLPIPPMTNIKESNLKGVLITPKENVNFIIEYFQSMNDTEYQIDKYIQMIDKFNMTNDVRVDEEFFKTQEKSNEKYPYKILSIDLGSENFITCLDSITFQPFIIDASYLFMFHKYYIEQLEQLNITKDSDLIFQHEKKLRRLIKSFVSKCVKYIINYCYENKITDLVIGIAGQRFNNDNLNYSIGKYNFSAILQGLFRYYIKQELEDNSEISYHEIDEYQTSSFCCKCGYYDKKGRNRNKNIFICKKCQTMIHGDVNAVINIMKRYCNEYLYPDKLVTDYLNYINEHIEQTNLMAVTNIVKVVKRKADSNPFLSTVTTKRKKK